MRLWLFIASGLVFAACSGNGNYREARQEAREADRPQPEMRAAVDVEADTAGDATATLEGIVRIVGNDPAPQVVLTVGEGSARSRIAVTGDYRAELGRLSGVRVSVAGDTVQNPQGIPQRAIDVLQYDILSVNSETAYLGVLEHREGDMWLDRAEGAFRVAALPDRLADMAGAKVWIAGPVSGNELRVRSFGIVREP